MRQTITPIVAAVAIILSAWSPALAVEKIYWTASGEIYRANLDGTQVEVVAQEVAWRLALDTARGKIYWTDTAAGAIRRANLDGSDAEDVHTGFGNIEGVAVDVEAGKLYWAARYLPANEKRIQRSNLDGSHIEDLVTVGMTSPAGIVLDTAAGKMYWITGIFNEKVQRANLDGSGVEDLFYGKRNLYSLALDKQRGKIYVTCTTYMPQGNILRADLDGSNVEDLSILGLMNPLQIDVDRFGRIYYADRELLEIRRANGVASEKLAATSGEPVGVALALPRDCNDNGVWDEQDIAGGTSTDCNGNQVPDECEPDCNENGIPDGCDIGYGTSADCNSNLTPDDCEPDCNNNGVADECDILATTSEDCTGNGVPDECEPDCDENGVPDSCDIKDGVAQDCNTNEIPDACEVADGTAEDSNSDGVPDECETKVYWTDSSRDQIQRANRDGSGLEDLVTTGLDQPKGIALDVVGGKMYWSDGVTDKIQRSNLDGSDVEDLVTDGGVATGLALDLARGKMYWCGGEKICRANLDGSGLEEVVTTESNTNGISLDVVNGKMYWAEDGFWRADLDGSNVEALPIDGSPAYLALDLPRGLIYWTEAHEHKVRRAYLDGSGTEDLAERLEQPLGIAVDPEEGKVYWAQSMLGIVQRANLDGSDPEVVVGGVQQPWALTIDTWPGDCNDNGVPDYEDLLSGTSEDCTGNTVPDECEPDCNDNGVPDSCDIDVGTSQDCNGNGFGVPDECEILDGTSEDCNANGVPDECEGGCNNNGIPDECEPDEDCNANGIRDICDIGDGTSQDCNGNSVPDLCDIEEGVSADCNDNGVPDECIADEDDCNGNLLPDLCDIAEGTSADANINGIPDECELCVDVFDCFDADPCTQDICTESDVCERPQITPCFEGGTISATAVAINDTAITPASAITVLSGDRITVEFSVTRWFPETPARYQVSLDPSGCISGLTGSLEALVDPDPEACVFVDMDRVDWLFHGLPGAGASCAVVNAQHLWCRGEMPGAVCDTDDVGESGYLATLVLGASSDASGTFTVAAGMGITGSSLTRCDSNRTLVEPSLTIVPLMVAVESDCNENDIGDTQEITTGTSQDGNGNGIPDECEAPAVTAEGCRYLGVEPHMVPLPIAFGVASPEHPSLLMWIGTGGKLVDSPVFQSSDDWGKIYAYGGNVVPNMAYEIQAEFSDGSSGPPAVVTTSRWGDAVGPFVDGGWTPADGKVGISSDATACLDRFRNLPTAPPVPWCDLEPQIPDGVINITDIMYIIDAFRGMSYPFDEPG